MKKKKVQKLLSAAMMVSICVTLGATPVSAANNGNEDVIVTSEHATQTDREEIDDTELSTIDPEILKETLNSVGQTRILYPVEEEAESEEMVTAPSTTTGGGIIEQIFSGTAEDEAGSDTIAWTYDHGTLTISTRTPSSPDTGGANAEIVIPSYFFSTTTTTGSSVTWGKDNVAKLKINGSAAEIQISDYTFQDCTNLKEVEITGKVTSIGEDAFFGCKALEVVDLSQSKVKTISQYAFECCANLSNVKLPSKTLEKIGDKAFSRCYALKGIKIPNSVVSIGTGIFDGTREGFDDEDEYILPDKADIAYQSHVVDIIAPTEPKNLSIDQGLVYDYGKTTLNCALKNQSSVVLPETLTKIGPFAFSGCVAKEITFTGKKPTFDRYSFSMNKFGFGEPDDDYYRLTATAYYPGDDESWKGIEKEDVGGNITWVPYEKDAIEGIIGDCKWVYNLKSQTFTITSNTGEPVEIPDFEASDKTPWATDPKASEIEKNCKTIIVDDSITRIGNNTFGKFFGQVENITLSQNLKSIGKDAFTACGAGTKKAPQFTLPDSLEKIEDGAFDSITELTEITIPKGVKELSNIAFLGCNKLKTVKVAEDNENLCSIDDVVYDKKVTTLVFCPPTKEKLEMPQSITRVKEKSFLGCSTLKEIKFTGNAPEFEDNCFILSEKDEKTTPLTITAYYPNGNDTWTEDKMKDYGGTVKWEGYNVGTEPGKPNSGKIIYHYDLKTNGGKWDGTHYYLPNGTMVTDAFFCDGTYTYYLQFDGTPLKGRLTYHPDGRHIIYFDDQGHEVFNTFANVKAGVKGDAMDELCYFNVYGFMYVNMLTYDQAGKNLYYANPNGVMERKGWFKFPEGNIGYANADGTLMVSQFSKDAQGRLVYFHANGKLARGLITDGVTYYKMDETDGHLVGAFRK